MSPALFIAIALAAVVISWLLLRRHFRNRSMVIIKRGLQVKFMFVIVLTIVLTAVVVGSSFWIFFSRVEVLTSDPDIRYQIFKAKNLFPVQLGFLFLIGAALSFFVSNKFAGPLYRFEKDIETIVKEGDLSHRIHLRDGDELKETADKLNGFLDELEQKIKRGEFS